MDSRSTIGIDPGPKESAVVYWTGSEILFADDVDNERMPSVINILKFQANTEVDVACEWIESFGMAVGKEVFQTVFAIGRLCGQLEEVCQCEIRLIPRRDIKIHLCGSMRAKDANIRQAIIDRHGAVGTKKNRGPMFGISGHKWSALAVALTASEIAKTEHEADFHIK